MALGYGYRVYGTETSLLDLEAGPGYRQVKLDTEEAEGDAVIRLALKGAWKLTKTATLTEDFVTEGLDFWISVVENAGFTVEETRLLQANDPSLNTLVCFTRN